MSQCLQLLVITHDTSPTKKLKLREFIYNTAIQLLAKYKNNRNEDERERGVMEPPREVIGVDNPARLMGRDHFPRYTDIENGRKKTAACVVCKHRKIRTRVTVECGACNVPLCIDPCFREFHTLKKL